MLRSYLKVAFRNLLKHKSFSLINVLGLAIGMACCILIMLWVQDERNFDSFHNLGPRIYRVIKIDQEDPNVGIVRVGAPWGPALHEAYPEVENFVRFRFFGRTFMRYEDLSFYESNGLYADSTIFSIFTYSFLEGDASSAMARPNSIVLTKSMAFKYFGDEPALGKTLLLDGENQFQVGAVIDDVPANSHFHFDFLVSFATYSLFDWQDWQMNNFHLYLLLADRASAPELQAKFPGFLAKHMTDSPIDYYVKLQPLRSIHLQSNYAREFEANGHQAYVYIFTAIAFFILAIACINFMNLATARSINRSREVGLRKVVGAQKSQVMRQFLGESVLTSFVALFVAIGLVELLLPSFNTLSAKNLTISYAGNPLLWLALATLALLVGIMAGSYPAFFMASFRPMSVLKGFFSRTGGGSRLRRGLVVFQFVISISMIITTLVVFEQLSYMRSKKLGIDKEQVLVLRTDNSTVQDRREAFKDELLKLPGVISVAASGNLPGGGDWGMPFRFEGRPEDEPTGMRLLVIDPAYLETLGIKLAQGRNFDPQMATDIDEAYLVNESAVKMLEWQEPVGKSIARPFARNAAGEWDYKSGRVVGVVKDFHFRSLHQDIQPLVMCMMPETYSYISIRLQPDNMTDTVKMIEGTWQAFDSERPFDYFFLDEIYDQMYRTEEKLQTIFAGFATLAVLVACLGLFGLASFTTEQRTKEIGIRKTLGAGIANILGLVTKEFCKWILIANIVAWPISLFVLWKWLENYAYRIELGWNSLLLWQILLVSAGLAMGMALLTVGYQAVKAALTNPVDALRYE